MGSWSTPIASIKTPLGPRATSCGILPSHLGARVIYQFHGADVQKNLNNLVLEVSWDSTPKSSILTGFSTLNHPAIGVPLFMETRTYDEINIDHHWTPSQRNAGKKPHCWKKKASRASKNPFNASAAPVPGLDIPQPSARSSLCITTGQPGRPPCDQSKIRGSPPSG